MQVVAGRLIVSCDISSPTNRLPVNLLVEYEGLHGLQLHNRAAAGLRAETADGQAVPLTLHFPDFDLSVPRRELGDEDLYEDFTKYHSIELGENALVGSIGAELLEPWKVTFDLAAGRLDLAPPGSAQAPPSGPVIDGDGSVTVPISLINDRAWLSVRFGDGSPGAMAIGTGLYDTLIDRVVAEQRGAPAGDIGALRVGNIDLCEYVALRPEDVVEVHPDGVAGVLGINALEHLKVEVDRVRRTARIERTAPAVPASIEADRAFFRARAAEETGPLIAFLNEFEGARLAPEAAKLLLDLTLDFGGDGDEIAAAVKWIFETTPEDLRTTRMLDLMVEMSDLGEDEVVLAAGALGVESGRDDRYPNAVHEVHGRLGRTLIERGERRDAWRHLLSAAFGLPEDGRINYDLGRFYELEGRNQRAFSRYVQAVIRPETGAEAIEALGRVQPLLEDGEALSVDTIERMIAGKVRNFGAASRFEPDLEHPAQRTVLCEYFTNAYLGDETAGAIGGALGNEGLISHFDPEYVVFLSHHLPSPQPDPLCTSLARARAELLGVGDPVVHVFDGGVRGPGAARWRQAEAVYQSCRELALARLTQPTDFRFEIGAEVLDGRLRGTVTVTGPELDDLVVQVVVAEKGVLFPGKSTVVVHRCVARAALTGDDLGLPFTPEGGVMDVDFDVSFDELAQRQEDFLEQLEAEGLGSATPISTQIDPRQARVVAFVFRRSSGAVLGAAQAEPSLPEELR
ncbi:hypothetical protein [Engelhardtia mirabilis]|uniref:Tetratricopeptide repeat protein n=1 Tax=Engelhardtia mirabilis TaxID=2528011 RepID=A0A518BGL3_9BACT|nr:hypothetical protein Pla133_11930 [Planctomycetes bacterium Pla133]QDV00454.1 hypothetical protein Pla86_11930 [Planctomycetes bacterium Pla86]